MASAELSRRVEKVVGYPLCALDDRQRRDLQVALLDADSFEDLPGKWQAAIVADPSAWGGLLPLLVDFDGPGTRAGGAAASASKQHWQPMRRPGLRVWS